MELVKDFVKSTLYRVSPPRLKASELYMAHSFHTERIGDDHVFEQLIRFCMEFRNLSGKRPLCQVFSGANPLVTVASDEHTRRLDRLSEVATLGFHGHYWFDPKGDLERFDNQMRGDRFDIGSIREQLESELHWFSEHSIEVNGIYSSGWWFTNPKVLDLISQAGFRFDLTFSRSRFSQSPFVRNWLDQHEVRCGEVLELKTSQGELTSIPFLLGCHRSRFPECFVRNLNPMIESGSRVTGVVGSHDYDLHVDRTLGCHQFLKTLPGVNYWDWSDVDRLTLDREIEL